MTAVTAVTCGAAALTRSLSLTYYLLPYSPVARDAAALDQERYAAELSHALEGELAQSVVILDLSSSSDSSVAWYHCCLLLLLLLLLLLPTAATTTTTTTTGITTITTITTLSLIHI